MQRYKKKPKTFIAKQWTGSNIGEFKDDGISCSASKGILEVKYWSEKKRVFKTLTVEPDHYLIVPSYGKPRVLNESAFAERFRI